MKKMPLLILSFLITTGSRVLADAPEVELVNIYASSRIIVKEVSGNGVSFETAYQSGFTNFGLEKTKPFDSEAEMLKFVAKEVCRLVPLSRAFASGNSTAEISGVGISFNRSNGRSEGFSFRKPIVCGR